MNTITWTQYLWRQSQQLVQCSGFAETCEIQLKVDTRDKGRPGKSLFPRDIMSVLVSFLSVVLYVYFKRWFNTVVEAKFELGNVCFQFNSEPAKQVSSLPDCLALQHLGDHRT